MQTPPHGVGCSITLKAPVIGIPWSHGERINGLSLPVLVAVHSRQRRLDATNHSLAHSLGHFAHPPHWHQQGRHTTCRNQTSYWSSGRALARRRYRR